MHMHARIYNCQLYLNTKQIWHILLYIEPLFSKFSDIFGRKWIMMIGITVFLFGSVLCGAANVSLCEK